MRDLVVVVDSSALIALSASGMLDLLQKLYRSVLITSVIRSEVRAVLPEWITVDDDYDQSQFTILRMDLDPGEASAIALALRHRNYLVLIDEAKGRKMARRLDLKISGTLGVLLKAKQLGVLDSGADALDRICKSGFYLSEELKQKMLELFNEQE
jgi:predicted nucleic acid-binding protein